ncbi:TPA: hypothetical protein NJU01_001467 [Acinetobacter baumannii]|uniref:hypothetical protein n=1 Tax=Acinetobacter baumannii TaxID=470 RepID=UPI000A3C9CDB|nr:hypothetical protein [Acinetobacter baumannii]OTT33468.1 hypothetical protein CAS82_05705 [Acinetobacter baumannii]HCG3336733.1 hypothetical protein [Acinetobacter baumannii]
MAKQLSVANIEYAGGKSAKGTKVKLSDGSYLAGVSFVETTVGVDQVAEVLIRLTPDFENTNETTNIEAETPGAENSTKD